MKLHIPISMVLFAATSSPSFSQDKAELAKKAQAILKANCYRCHGENGANEGGFNFVLDQSRLLATKKVVPGNLRASRLYKRLIDEDMPPQEDAEGKPVKQRPSESDIAVIKQWIEADAPDFNPAVAKRESISPNRMLEIIRDDLRKIPERDRKFIRYFTLTHLSNAGFSDDEMQSYRSALSKLTNSLSWGREIVVPKPIDPANSILRINLTDYDWDETIWDAILAANPYGISYTTEAARECYKTTQCKLPHVRGDWFVHAAARPPLYHSILKLPKTDKELEKELRVDVAENIRKELVRRAGFNGSGVSQNNRLIERHRSSYGAYWKSYDFAGKVERKNLFQHPLGPGDDKDSFEHDGGEIIFNLPNKLQAYLLVDAKGNRIDKGPLSVVSDPKQKDRAVVNGISCMSCHAKGIIQKSDQVREAVLKAKGSYTAEEVETITRLYPPKEDFDKLLREDAEAFRKAVEATGAKLSATEPIVALSIRFEDELDVKLAAAEVGVSPAEFLKGLGKAPTTLGRAFASLRLDGGTVQREVMVKQFGELVAAMNLGRFHPADDGASGSPAERKLKEELDQISRQLNSSKIEDRIAGLEAAKEMKSDAAPLMRRVCELMFEQNQKVAILAGSTYKAFSPKLYEFVMSVRAEGFAKGGLVQEVWVGLVHLVDEKEKNVSVAPVLYFLLQKPSVEPSLTRRSLFTLREFGDKSTTHYNLAMRHLRNPDANARVEAVRSLSFTVPRETKKERDAAVKFFVSILNDEPIRIRAIEAIASFGADAKAVIFRLRPFTLDSNKELRDAAEAAIEKIEKAKE